MKRILLLMSLVLGLCLAREAHAQNQNLTVKITKTDGTTTTVTGKASLQAALSGIPKGEVQALEISAGDFVTADWTWLQANRTNLNALESFTIQETIGSVADIPNTENGKPYFNKSSLQTLNVAKVQRIGALAFNASTKLTTADFPQATSIGRLAFCKCAALTTTNFPKVTTIGNYVFGQCNALDSVHFSEATSIGDSAFYLCAVLTTASFPKALRISDFAFNGCKKLNSIYFPEATSIGRATFYQCRSLTTADFPQATSIGRLAFCKCAALTTTKFPKVTTIGNYVFGQCNALDSVHFSEATSIGDSAFYLCAVLTTASFPKALRISDFAFNGCEKLNSVTFPQLTNIGVKAFSGCYSLVNLLLADTPPTVADSNAFENCPSPRYLVLTDSDGIILGDESLERAKQRYETHNGFVDGKWYGWTFAETWVQVVTSQPAGWVQDADGYYIIDSPENLAWFISFVNGYNGCAMNPTAKGKITADIDMSAYQWVPIASQVPTFNPGSVGYYSSPIVGYSGLFDGGYHVVKGLRNFSAMVPRSGLFDKIYSGKVQKVIVADCDFHAAHVPQVKSDGFFGLIANEVYVSNLNDEGIRFCEASGKLTADAELAEFGWRTYLGGLVGRIGVGTNVHSCISHAMLKGQRMGGLVGYLQGELFNCYAYPSFWIPEENKESDFGGLVCVSSGDMKNCYIRERETEDGYRGVKALMDKLKAVTYQISRRGCIVYVNRTKDDGTGGNIECCYIPDDYKTLKLFQPGLSNIKVPKGTGLYTQTETPYLYAHADNKAKKLDTSDTTNTYIGDATDRNLVDVLNAWVDEKNTVTPDKYARWNRTCASSVNGDYPVLLMPVANAVASDGILLYYGDVSNLLTRQLDTPSQTDDAVFQYADARLSVAAIQSTKEFYVGEGVCVVPEDLNSNATGPAKTHVGVTFDNSATGWDWHMFSSSLANAPLGIDYTNNNEYAWDATNLPQYAFSGEGFFPAKEYGSNADYYGHWDFYCYDEPSCHFINFKRNSNSHWHQDGNHEKINYTNETELTPGKGYMMAIDQPTFMQSCGILQNGPVTRAVTKSAAINPGYNLIGNPYQSILDFDAFADANTTVLGTSLSYTIFDAAKNGYVSYTKGTSIGATTASRSISPLQGFFLCVPANGNVTFDNTMRKLEPALGDNYAGFRGGETERPAYPLVNLIATDDNGKNDILVVEFDRPENGGARKMIPVRSGKGSLYARHEDENMSIAFVEKGITEIPVRFETMEDAVFTMTSQPANGPFRYLHLIDNITGIDHDLLADSTFTFDAKASDYKSRFKLVMALEAVDEVVPGSIADQFAYFDGGTWIVEAKGDMEVYDLTGRLMKAQRLVNAQNSIDLSGLASGVYLVRVSNGSDAKMQKIVLE